MFGAREAGRFTALSEITKLCVYACVAGKDRERKNTKADAANSSEIFLNKYKIEFCLSLSHPILRMNVILRGVRVTIVVGRKQYVSHVLGVYLQPLDIQ